MDNHVLCVHGLVYDVGHGRPIRRLLPVGKENESGSIGCSVADETVR